MSSDDNAEEILTNYKRMVSECQQIASKIGEASYVKFAYISLYELLKLLTQCYILCLYNNTCSDLLHISVQLLSIY